MSQARALADMRRRLDAVYGERRLNGRWEGLAGLLVKWTPHVPVAQPTPPPTPRRRPAPAARLAPNVIILADRVRQRLAAADARDAARGEEA